MIVKVQISQFPKQQMLIYDKKHAYHYEGDVTDNIRRKMGTKFKAYFYATIKDGRLIVDDEALAQVW